MVKRRKYSLDDLDLSVLEENENSKFIILFLHGIPASAEIWRNIIEKMADSKYRCIAPDLPGYGLSIAKPEFNYSLKNMAVYLNEFIQSLDAEKVWLVGHDIGGGVAQIMITQAPDLFEKVTLSNCITADSWPIPPISKLGKLAKRNLFSLFAILGIFSSKKLYASLNRSFVNSRKLPLQDFQRIFYDGKFSRWKSAKNFQSMLAALDNTDTIQNMTLLKACKLPVHLLWGIEDKFQPWDGPGVILESTFQNVLTTKIDAGHFLQLDASDEYTKCLLEMNSDL